MSALAALAACSLTTCAVLLLLLRLRLVLHAPSELLTRQPRAVVRIYSKLSRWSWLILLLEAQRCSGSVTSKKKRNTLSMLAAVSTYVLDPDLAAEYALILSTGSLNAETHGIVDELVNRTSASIAEWRAARPIQSPSKSNGALGKFVVLPACGNGTRIGLGGEQAKMLCEQASAMLSRSPCSVVSVGSNGDASFEQQVHNRWPDCAIETWDGTLTGRRAPLRNRLPQFIEFVPRNFGGSSWSERHANENDTMAVRGTRATILKIDCEGCELEALVPWVSHVCTGMVLMELHGINTTAAALMLQSMAVAGFRPVYGEDNPKCGPTSGMRCTELALARTGGRDCMQHHRTGGQAVVRAA